ncbi:peptidylprolyl isomerase [Sphingomonas rubra]|uniref:Peptidyl-prolyl cis-trans isomerase D n=1 Tax=Sphingomonas rubra TaxID=634430 RepID=A0A1I5PT27_9SPHN|nr:peptidylprolyl isomerase [Sphingomonas rubra]SFP37195.1 peptidyl-prolyl cis-trans isomerase D [Sphingomonas rubra]
MLGFFRRIINSKVGIVVTFIVLGIVALAFAAGDVSNLSIGSGGVAKGDVAQVGDADVTVNDLRTRAQEEVAAAQRQQPTADMDQYLAAGALERALEQLVTTTALAEYARDQGMVVSKRLVDGQIASIPALQGPNGKFDEQAYRRILAERRLTDARIRADIARDVLVQQLIGPTVGAAQVSAQLALPYASLLLERRAGQVAFVPTAAVPAGPAPTPQEVQSFYGRNLNRYRVPERRVIRYALVTPEAVRARATPTEAEIAQAYAADRAKYAATERRDITQVIVFDQAGAAALAAKVRGGTALAVAARAAGLEPSTIPAIDKAAYAGQTSAAVADAVFGAAQGAVVGPVRGPIGFVVARVDKVEQVAGRSLAQVRDEIAAALTARKTADALADLRNTMDEGLSGSATFDEAVADAKLTASTTGALAATGTDPLSAEAQPDPALQPLVAAAFQAQDGDPPQLVQTAPDGSFAIVAVGRVLPAAPRPLAEIRDRVAADFVADRRQQAARRIADEVLARVNRGTPLPRSLQQANVALPAARPIAASRAQLAQARGGAEPALALMFSMAPNTAKLLAAPQGAGWLVIKLDQIQRGDASKTPGAVAAARSDIGRSIGAEYTEQFARAVRASLGVKTEPAAIARVKADLSGQGGSGN